MDPQFPVHVPVLLTAACTEMDLERLGGKKSIIDWPLGVTGLELQEMKVGLSI